MHLRVYNSTATHDTGNSYRGTQGQSQGGGGAAGKDLRLLWGGTRKSRVQGRTEVQNSRPVGGDEYICLIYGTIKTLVLHSVLLLAHFFPVLIFLANDFYPEEAPLNPISI